MGAFTRRLHSCFGHPLARASLIIGASFAGFFDGIIIHQLLQWHHMICPSATCEAESLEQMEGMQTPDGLFHLAMYLAMIAGVGRLVHALIKQDYSACYCTETPCNCHAKLWRLIIGCMSIGGGVFQVIEGIVDHFILRIHRVNPRSSSPLAWDLSFLLMGALIVAAGLLLVPADFKQAGGLSPPPESVAPLATRSIVRVSNAPHPDTVEEAAVLLGH